MSLLSIRMIGDMGSDCTSPYEVTFRGNPTLKDVLPELIESGRFVDVNGRDCVLSKPYQGFSEKELDTEVKEIRGRGGYGRMSYSVRGKDGSRIGVESLFILKYKIDMEYRIENNVNKFKIITDKMVETYKAKNHDYGNSFDISLNQYGLVASAMRLGDKINRFNTLISKDRKVVGESLRDTLLDMANYAVMTVMWMDNNKKEYAGDK